jgi:predicted lactoylglutathione lyase
MVGYSTIGTNDMARAGAFYDALLGELGGKRLMDMGRFVLWAGEGGAMFAVANPYDGKPATVGNGVMIALQAKSREQVDAIYQKALALGGTDEGPPGVRGGTFYAGYFRDLDGNKLNAFFMG